jgi:hypothetical protein
MQIKKSDLAGKARIISKVTNPCILSIIMLFLILLTRSDSLRILISGAATIAIFLVLLPLAYIFIKVTLKKDDDGFPADPTIFLKQHPRDILIMGLICGLPCLYILILLDSPTILIHTLLLLLAASAVIALLYLFYRVSFHIATVTILAVMSGVIWGQAFFFLAAMLPLIAWSKYQIRDHTPFQMIAAIILAVTLVMIYLYLYTR